MELRTSSVGLSMLILTATACGSKEAQTSSSASAVGSAAPKGSASATAATKTATKDTKFPLPTDIDKVAHPARYGVLVPVPKGTKPVLKDHAGTWAFIKDWGVSMSDNSANCGDVAKVKEAIGSAKLVLDEPDQLIWENDGKLGFYALAKLPNDAGVVCCIGKEVPGKDGFGGDLPDIAIADQKVASRADAERGIAVCQGFDWKP